MNPWSPGHNATFKVFSVILDFIDDQRLWKVVL